MGTRNPNVAWGPQCNGAWGPQWGPHYKGTQGPQGGHWDHKGAWEPLGMTLGPGVTMGTLGTQEGTWTTRKAWGSQEGHGDHKGVWGPLCLMGPVDHNGACGCQEGPRSKGAWG